MSHINAIEQCKFDSWNHEQGGEHIVDILPNNIVSVSPTCPVHPHREGQIITVDQHMGQVIVKEIVAVSVSPKYLSFLFNVKSYIWFRD